MASSQEAPTIGIYLGTAYSCVGVWHHGRVEIIMDDQGNCTTPSFVAFTDNEWLIGEAAKNQADMNPTNTIFDMNLLIGRRFSDPTVQRNRKVWPFNVIQGAGDKPKIVVQYRGEEKQFQPEQLSAMILKKMKEIAENFLECIVQNAVITVPDYFSDLQRQATKDAGEIVGLKVMHIMDVPIAAAVAYSFKKFTYVFEEKTVLVFDLSVSTFDVSVVENKQGVFKVKAMAGDTHLGGNDFDNHLMNDCLHEIKWKHKKDIRDNPMSIWRLRSACEQAKRSLSFKYSSCVEVACLYEGIDFINSDITRDQFEDLNMDLFKRCMGLVTKCLEDARIDKTTIDKVLLVGGNTQIPKVQQMLKELFDGKELCESYNPNEVVAYGAALQAAMLDGVPHVALGAENEKKQINPDNANQEGAALQRELSEAQKLIEQLISERDDARKLSEAAQKLTEQLMSERDDAGKLSEAVQKLTEQLMSERDDARKLSEAVQKLTEQLMSERDDAREEVEELRPLTEQQAPGSQCVGYSYSDLQDATNNFHESFKLGEGGFGIVYKGILHKTTVAIKILKEGGNQGAKEFNQEFEIVSKLRHPNLVTLIGACAETRAIIYEYLPNGNLEDRLQCKNNTLPLSWQARTRIAFEICSALSFLHCSKPHGIVHGDLKPDNVLLDLNDVSKISDFGLCRQLNWTASTSQPSYFTDCPKGTFGYIDPEFFTTLKMTPQNDVYSFGIMLLQLVTCKDPLGIRQLVEEAQREGTLKALIDVSAGPWPFKEAEKMISLGLRCSDLMRNNRPDLSIKVRKEMKSLAQVASASWSSWAASLFHR